MLIFFFIYNWSKQKRLEKMLGDFAEKQETFFLL